MIFVNGLTQLYFGVATLTNMPATFLAVFRRVISEIKKKSVRSFLMVSLYDALLQLTELPHASTQWLFLQGQSIVENGFATEFMAWT